MSYFEWVQNNQHEQWDLEEINHKLRRKIQQAVDTVVDRRRRLPAEGPAAEGPKPADLRTAALVVAIERLASITLQRGIWP